jgi:putative ABC transport system permease protein
MPLRLIWHNLLSHPIRSAFTVGSVALAIFLLCFLQATLVALDAGVEGAATNRVVVQSAVSLFVDLPLSYQKRIEQLEGVETTCKLQWFGGYYQHPGNFFAQFAVDPDRFLEVYHEVEIVDGSIAALQTTRSGCLIGTGLQRRFGWKVGDTIPIIPTIFRRTDGQAWEFTVVGIYEANSPSLDDASLFFPHEYIQESQKAGDAGGPDGVGVYTVLLAPGADIVATMAAIDAMFDAGPQRVQATTEAEFNRQFVSMLGNIPTLLTSIGGGVLFAIALAVLNTMLMAARERTHDLAILKALGFGDGVVAVLLVIESLLVCGIGALLGLGGVGLVQGIVARVIRQIFPSFHVDQPTMLLGLGLALAIGLLAGLLPAVGALRLRCVEALRAEG